MQTDAALRHGLSDHSLAAPRAVTVCEPMSVLWQGVEYPAAFWDVHGFALQQPLPSVLAPGRGRVVDVALLIGQGETRIQMNVQARAMPGDEAGLRYQFIDLGRAQAELLHRVVDYAITKQEMSLTQLLNDSRETRVAREQTTEKMLSFRTWFQASLACAALGAAAMAAFGSFASVTSRYAAVSGAAASVSTPAAGMVSELAVGPGAQVLQGDVLAYLRSPDHDRRAETLSDRLRALEAEQAELRLRRAELDRHADYEMQAASAGRDRLQEAVARAQARLELEGRQLAMLRTTGLPTLERQQARNRQEALVIAVRDELAEAEAALQAFETAQSHGLASASAGVTGANGMTIETIDLRLAHLREEIALAYARDEEHLRGTPILSPCNCEVAQVNRVVGEWIEPSQPLLVLAQSGARAVHALVMADAAGQISQGDRARIQLADGQTLSGRVVALNYNSQQAGVAGLKTDVFAAERYARVELELDQADALPIGLTGTVTIRTLDPLAWLRDRMGV